MAVAHDALSRSSTSFDNNTVSWTHTPVGTPRGVVVMVAQEAEHTDQIAGVTYGGIGMTRELQANKITAEAGGVYVFSLLSGVPSGPQTVTVTTSPATGADDFAAHCATVTASTASTVISATASLAATSASANPSLAISPSAASVIYYVIWTGLAAPVTTVQAGGTHNFGNDFGADSMMSSRKAVAAGATTMGYTAASDVFAHAAVAIAEVSGTSDAAPLGLASAVRPDASARTASPPDVAASATPTLAHRAAAAAGVVAAVAAGVSPGSVVAAPAVLGVAVGAAGAPGARIDAGTATAVAAPSAASARQEAGLGLVIAAAAPPASTASTAASAGLAVGTGPAAAARGILATRGASAMRALVPAYFYPSWYLPGGSPWDDLEADPLGISYVVMNQDSGMGAASNSDYALEVGEAKAAGLRVLAYVPTSFAATPIADVLGWMQNHRDWYDVDGFFIDEAASGSGDVAYYRQVREWADANMAAGQRTVVLNHGTVPDEGFTDVGDVLVTYENTGALYAAATFPAWMDEYSPSRFAHIVHTTALADWPAVRALAADRPVGHLYVTDQAYSALPSYWGALQDSMSAGTSSGAGAVFPGIAARAAATAGQGSAAAPSASAAQASGTGSAAAATVVVAARQLAAQGIATGQGTPADSSAVATASPGAAASTSVPPSSAAAAPAATGQAAAAGPTASAAQGLTGGLAVATAGIPAACAQVQLGVAVGLGVAPSSMVASSAAAGGATAAGAAPHSATAQDASPGAAASVGVPAAAVAGAPTGFGSLTGVTVAAAALAGSRSAAWHGVPPASGGLDTTPIPGVAVGLGVTPSSSAAAAAVAGSAVATTVALTTRALVLPGAATTVGGTPGAAATPLVSAVVAAGMLAVASSATTPGVVTWLSSTASTGAMPLLGLAARGTSAPSSEVVVTVLPGMARAVGVTPSAGERADLMATGSRGTLDAVERLPSGMVVAGVEPSGAIVSGVELVGT